MWHSNAPWIKTGYGQQTGIWVPRLAALGHDVTISGPFSFAGSPMGWAGFNVLPGAQDPFGSDVIAGHYRRNQCDVLISLCDVFMMDPESMKGLNVVHWLPVDCTPMGAADAAKARGAAAVIAMSQYGDKQMRQAGFEPFYIPHGIDTGIFSPPDDQKFHRQQLGFDPDHFLIGMNAANKEGPRKAIVEQIVAFADFHARHPESRLLIHSFASPRQGLDIKQLADALGVADMILLPDQYAYACGMMDDQTMSRWYGLLDVLLNATYGEGFGIPIVEAQACGVPVIVTDASTGPELCGSGWKVQGEPFWVQGHNAWWTRPNIKAIIEALEASYSLWEKGDAGMDIESSGEHITYAEMRKRAREFGATYDADLILEERWKPLLEHLDDIRPKTARMEQAQREVLPEPEHVEGLADMLAVVPSRGRPANVRRLIESIAATRTSDTRIVFGFDDDDPDMDEYQKIIHEADPDGKVVFAVKTGERKGLAEWTNALALEFAPHCLALLSMGDDHEPITHGWDTELLKVLDADQPGMAYPDDKVRNDIPQIVAISSPIVQALGWMCEPSLKHYFVDNVWGDLGQMSGCLTFLPDVVVEHQHHLRHPGKVVRDETYKNNEKKFPADMQSFEVWRRERLQADAAKIRALREPVLLGAAEGVPSEEPDVLTVPSS